MVREEELGQVHIWIRWAWNRCLDSKGSYLCLANMIRESVGMKDNSVLIQRENFNLNPLEHNPTLPGLSLWGFWLAVCYKNCKMTNSIIATQYICVSVRGSEEITLPPFPPSFLCFFLFSFFYSFINACDHVYALYMSLYTYMYTCIQ